jgi:hypothetical protein
MAAAGREPSVMKRPLSGHERPVEDSRDNDHSRTFPAMASVTAVDPNRRFAIPRLQCARRFRAVQYRMARAVDHRTVGLILSMDSKTVRFHASSPEQPRMVSDR